MKRDIPPVAAALLIAAAVLVLVGVSWVAMRSGLRTDAPGLEGLKMPSDTDYLKKMQAIRQGSPSSSPQGGLKMPSDADYLQRMQAIRQRSAASQSPTASVLPAGENRR